MRGTLERRLPSKRPNSPCPELDAWLEKGQHRARVERSLGRLGRRARLREAMMDLYGEVPVPFVISFGDELPEKYKNIRLPKMVKKAAEGLMDDRTLPVWWLTPNEWMWPDVDDPSYYDGAGTQRVSPKMLWKLGQKDDVIDLLMAMKGDPYEQVIAAVTSR